MAVRYLLIGNLPESEELRKLITKVGPIIAPSANHEGLPPATTIEEAKAYFGADILIYIDDGIRRGRPSGLIDLTGEQPLMIRPLP